MDRPNAGEPVAQEGRWTVFFLFEDDENGWWALHATPESELRENSVPNLWFDPAAGRLVAEHLTPVDLPEVVRDEVTARLSHGVPEPTRPSR